MMMESMGPQLLSPHSAFWLALALICLHGCGENVGNAHFFNSQLYQFATVRTLGSSVSGGADIGEVHTVVSQITDGDEQSWYGAWNSMAEQLELRAESLKNPTSKGLALLRASNYYRTAEFFLSPDDEKRSTTYRRSIDTFREGLERLEVPHEFINVPYEAGLLAATYYPGQGGADQQPLIVAGTGFDSTQEELYFKVAAGALERGYPVLTYDGPGQGAPLRLHDLKFTYEWEKPVGAILDAFLSTHDAPPYIILLGTGLGGYLAPRAAAYDERIDGVVAFGAMYDFREASLARSPPLVTKLLYRLADAGRMDWAEALVQFRARLDPASRWGYNNALWTLGATDVVDMLEKMEPFTLATAAQDVTSDVLILHGSEDYIIPDRQFEKFESALTNAKSVTSHVYDRSRGGHLHGQMGANMLWQEDFFDWLEEKFPRSNRLNGA